MSISRDDLAVEDADWMRREKVRLLLAYLVQHPVIRRRELAAALWPALEIEKALANVRTNLRLLLRVLHPGRPAGTDSWFIETDGAVIVFRRDRFVIDADEFDASITQAQQAESRGVPGEALVCYQEALEHYGGSYLEESYQDVSAEFERIRLQSVAALAAVRVAELLLAKGEPEDSIRFATLALDYEPLLERAHRSRIRALLALEDRHAARSAAKLLLSALAEAEMELEPDSHKVLAGLGLETN